MDLASFDSCQRENLILKKEDYNNCEIICEKYKECDLDCKNCDSQLINVKCIYLPNAKCHLKPTEIYTDTIDTLHTFADSFTPK